MDHDLSYYKKYLKEYNKREEKTEYQEPKVAKKNTMSDYVKKWSFNSNVITELAKITEKEYNVLANLGLTEGIEYEHIVNGTINPSLKLKITKYHMNRILNYINVVIRDYNILKSRSYLRTVPLPIKNMIKEYQFKSEDLPKIFVEYREHLEQFKHNDKKDFISQWMLFIKRFTSC